MCVCVCVCVIIAVGMEVEHIDPSCSLSVKQPRITGVYPNKDPIDVFWLSYFNIKTDHTLVVYNRNCEEVKPPLNASSAGNNPIELDNSEFSVTDYLFQIQDSTQVNHSTIYDLATVKKRKRNNNGIGADVWYRNQNDILIISFNRRLNQEVCIILDLMQSVDAVCFFKVEDFPYPFQDCSTSATSTYGQVCANASQLKNMTLFTTFEGQSAYCPTDKDYPLYSKVISSHLLLIIGK